MTKDEFENELKLDQEYELREQARIDWEINHDYEKFIDYYAEDFNETVVALKRLRDLHHKHNHPFEILELGDLI